MSDALIIIPTYNEKENIERMISTLLSLEHSFDVLVVDDGSPDGTAALVKGMPAKEVVERLKGVECGVKGTSCPDQLAKNLELIIAQA